MGGDDVDLAFKGGALLFVERLAGAALALGGHAGPSRVFDAPFGKAATKDADARRLAALEFALGGAVDGEAIALTGDIIVDGGTGGATVRGLGGDGIDGGIVGGLDGDGASAGALTDDALVVVVFDEAVGAAPFVDPADVGGIVAAEEVDAGLFELADLGVGDDGPGLVGALADFVIIGAADEGRGEGED